MNVLLTTNYRPHPTSNVGSVVATTLGRQATVRWDQALTSDANHRAAAQLLVDRLAEFMPNLTLGDQIQANDSGTRRQFATHGGGVPG